MFSAEFEAGQIPLIGEPIPPSDLVIQGDA